MFAKVGNTSPPTISRPCSAVHSSNLGLDVFEVLEWTPKLWGRTTKLSESPLVYYCEVTRNGRSSTHKHLCCNNAFRVLTGRLGVFVAIVGSDCFRRYELGTGDEIVVPAGMMHDFFAYDITTFYEFYSYDPSAGPITDVEHDIIRVQEGSLQPHW